VKKNLQVKIHQKTYSSISKETRKSNATNVAMCWNNNNPIDVIN
jgi:hypothetical protein